MTRLSAASWIIFLMVFASLASAQDGDAPVRATIEKFFGAFNSGNLPAATQVWRQDAVDINFRGMISGGAQLNERIGAELKLGVKLDHMIERIDINGSMAWAVGPYSVTIPSQGSGSTQSSGAWLQVLRQDHGTWKIQAASFTRNSQPK